MSSKPRKIKGHRLVASVPLDALDPVLDRDMILGAVRNMFRTKNFESYPKDQIPNRVRAIMSEWPPVKDDDAPETPSS